jgi:hypothetical protein
MVAVIWCLFWCLLVTDSPSEHSTITAQELDFIQSSIGMTPQEVKVVNFILLQSHASIFPSSGLMVIPVTSATRRNCCFVWAR